MPRLRDLGVVIGALPTGPHNAITDVPGVLVGHTTLISDGPRIARTGVTMIVPRDGAIWNDHAFAAYHVFNGNGEMTGLPWLDEAGLLGAPIGLTNTNQVGVVRDAIVRHAVANRYYESFFLPVVAETWDGLLNDIDAFHLTTEHAIAAIESAAGGPVPEGNVGGGTGMICHDFKGGIGTASRVVETAGERYTVGALVQSNYGERALLRIDGVPVGLEITHEEVPSAWRDADGSIIVILATDAPLLPIQCKRLARRATTGLAWVGGIGSNGSGDIFLAFSTGNAITSGDAISNVRMVVPEAMTPLFLAAAEATQEAILNSLTAAETTTGFRGRTAHAIPLDRLQEIMRKYRPG